ncbi:hypothetical protein MK079_03555 [Candidatus Gracilibacteria bacterium]|nr:hypothetical protein [Candidatus Gracilibacteria bacterium]
MKKIIASLALALLTVSNVFAGDESWSEPKTTEVEYYNFGLEVSVENGEVFLEWDAYEGDDLKWYKIVHSHTNATPVYPHDRSVAIYDDAEKDEAWDKAREGTSYYRVCVVTVEDDRRCGDVVKVEIDADEAYSYEKKEKYSDGEYEKKREAKKESYEDKKYDAKEKIKAKYAQSKEQKYTKLSSKIKTRLKNFVSNFEKRLAQSDLSDSEKSDRIETVITKLEALSDKKPRLADMIDYIIDSLTELQAEYSDDLSEIESLLNIE